MEWSDAIATGGHNAAGVIAQSIGGGGGSAGTTVAGSGYSQFSAQAAVGGAGGSGGGAAKVQATLSGMITTGGDVSPGLIAQSVGGGGGHSGTVVSGTALSSMAVAVSVGGSGGDGGDGGDLVAYAGAVATSGHSSAGIAATSVGGGGGSAHFTGAFSGVSSQSLDASVGGSGGAAGDGGSVNVGLGATITTKGHNAPGIKAMSIGGGGGDSGTTVSGSLSGAAAMIVAGGGDGGTSGSGGAVSVSTASDTAAITTSGEHAEGIFAASVARSGGSAGHVVSGSAFSAGDLGLNIGGSGGRGGNAGAVQVTSTAAITTAGGYATGIEARSAGGGGGSAKGSITASALSMGNLAATIGGSGGSGGKAGTVTVTSGGAIATGDHHAYGILAQSLGGSGGNGGYAAQASFTGGEVSGEAAGSLGGSGGNGGTADAVSVTSTAAISTGDFRAAGILAQSVGGGGGSGGNVYTGNLSISTDGSATANVDIGGTGGAGAVAGTAMVSNAAGLATDGYLADGILAQSIGGNGGSGGSAYSVLATVQGANNANFGVDVGGKGGSGGDAAEVSVDNSGTISTGKGGSDAIAAMSVGGGGGKAGSAANINLNPLRAGAPTGNSLSATVTVGVGGSGGAAGDGAAVTLTNAGALSTEGDGSRAIHALSVGGGGGDGGTASSYSLSFNGVCSALSGGLGYGCKAKPTDPNTQTTNVNVNLTAEVGGSGGAAGDGDAVKVTNTGTIKTAGHLAHGVSAHSIGGGGGNGGEGAIGLQGWTTNKTANAIAGLPGNFTFIPSYSNISMTIGGTGGASGDGGAVTVGGAGSIETAGDHAYGVRAQSVGGGGGNGGAGAAGLWGVLTVGGRGSGGGDGGDVAVSQGPVTTSGDGSIAIFAQSVGGGGGTAGDVEKGWTAAWADLNIGAGVAAQQSPGSGGDGGDVTVTAGPISTTGADATAIAAQSVGGSGGIAQVSGLVGGDGPMTFAGGAGDQGDAGLVTVTTNGAISVTGARGHGIFAQSTTGRTGSQDKSGGVAITINADLAATGADGRAILAQSEGGFVSLTGPIAITVAEGATVETGVGGAETIGIIDGNANTLANSGTIRNPGTAADDYVIRTNGIAPLAVENDGVIEGSVLSQMPASISTPNQAITVTNAEGAAFGLGATVDLGAGGSFANAGTISPGTVGTIGTSRFSGALTQAATGTLHVDYDVGGADDLLSVAAGVQPALAGTVDPEAQGTVPTSGTKGSFAFLTAASGLSSNGLTVADTATVDYALSQQAAPGGGQQVSLSYDIHYAPWLGSPIARARARAADRAITPNHTRFARHVDDLVRFRAGATGRRGDDYPFVADLAFYLLEVPTVDDLLDVYDRFAPTGIFAPGDAALFGSLRFADGLNSCPGAGVDGVMVFVREGACAWLRTAGVATRRDSDGTSAAYDENVFSLSGGGQTELQQGWFGGFALGYETSEISGDGLDGDGYRIHAGAVLKRELGRTTLSASVSGGYGSTDLKRQVLTSAGLRRAAGSPDLTWIAGHLRAEHRVDMTPSSHLRPWIDLGITHIMQVGYDETGAGDYGLAVDPIDTTYMTLNPVLDFGTRFEIGGMAAEATLSGGALIFLGDTDRSADAHLIGIGDAGPGFRVTDEGRQVYGDLGGSIKAQLNRRTSFEVALDTLLGEVEQQYRATAKLMIAF